jgi:uncharacterized protein
MSKPVTLPEIESVWWSQKLGQLGTIATDADDINQAIAIILSTPLGSDPHRPEFGSDLFNFIDYPINEASPHLVRESFGAIGRWEPRVEIEDVQVFPAVEQIHQVLIQVVWRLKDDGIQGTAEVNL